MLPSARGAIAYKKAEKEILGVVSFLPPTSVFFVFVFFPSPPFPEFTVLARFPGSCVVEVVFARPDASKTLPRGLRGKEPAC